VHDHRLLADVEPLDVTGIRTVSVGTVLFLLCGLALLPFHGWLESHDHVWWLWTCFAGFGLGVFGFTYCRRRARHHHDGRLDHVEPPPIRG
jgi:drug/metabolite transporter (DMT)-like permease